VVPELCDLPTRRAVDLAGNHILLILVHSSLTHVWPSMQYGPVWYFGCTITLMELWAPLQCNTPFNTIRAVLEMYHLNVRVQYSMGIA